MKKFLVLYMAPMSGADQMKGVSPDDAQKGMEPWIAWYNKAGSAIVEPGAPLGESEHVGETTHPKSPVHVSGYTVIQAEDMTSAKKVLDGHPHLTMPNSCIEVLEMMPMGM